jgi:hypothetical protein
MSSAKKHKIEKNDKHAKKKLVPPVKVTTHAPQPPVAKKPGKPEKPDLAAKAPAGKAPGAPAAPSGKPGRKERKGRHRRELNFAEGELLLPNGPMTVEEILYMMRGAVCAERPAGEAAIEEIVTKRGLTENAEARAELTKQLEPIKKRFDTAIDPMLPSRAQGARRTFQSVIDRARYRRREMGAFMRGLDLGRTEMGHMDPHGEDSLHELMKWAARLENLLESEEPEKADYAQFHRGLDQLENTTEALIIDVEQTLRRLRDRNRAG